MSIAQSLLPEFDHEMANTRKTLERVPENKLDYKPDPKSMSMGVLASHIAEMAGWLPAMAQGPALDIPEGFKPFLATSRKQLLDKFDENVAASRAALAAMGDQAFTAGLVAQFRRQHDVHHASDRGIPEHDHEPHHPPSGSVDGLLPAERHSGPGAVRTIG